MANSPNKNRIDFIDCARGISIILVVLHHNPLKHFILDWINAFGLFRMPLFFLLSGVFFSYKLKPVQFVSHKASALLKPYFATLIFLFVARWLLGKDDAPVEVFAGILYGNSQTIIWQPLWFLSHLFLVHCFSYLLFNYLALAKLQLTSSLLLVLVFISIGSYYIDIFWPLTIEYNQQGYRLPGLPFSADLLLLSSAFFIAGNKLKHCFSGFKPQLFLLLLALLGFILVVTQTQAQINFNKRIYQQAIYASIAAASGIYLVLCLAYYLCLKRNPFSRLLIYLGNSSLFLLIFHSYLAKTSYYWLNKLALLNSEFTAACFAFIFSLFAPLAIRWLIISLPWLAYFYLPRKAIRVDSQKH